MAGAVVAAAIGAFLYLQHTEPAWWARLWFPLRYDAIVRGHATNYHLDASLLAAVIEQESKFNTDAESRTGACRPDAARAGDGEGDRGPHGRDRSSFVSDLYNPEINVRYGAWYLRHLLDKYRDERTALAAYNAGQENVDRWRARPRGRAVPGDARVCRPRRVVEEDLPARVRLTARLQRLAVPPTEVVNG